MRSDMHKVIVDHPRYGGHVAYSTRMWSKYRDHEDADEVVYAPTQRKKLYRDYKVFGDRVSPLRRFLAANCGRPWRLVYSEVCSHADSRSVIQNHLREHVLMEVLDADHHTSWYDHYKRFYVDRHGILRQTPKTVWSRTESPKTWLRVSDTEGYVVIDGCYYHAVLNYVDGVVRSPKDLWRYYGSDLVHVTKRALSTKEIQKHGLRERLPAV